MPTTEFSDARLLEFSRHLQFANDYDAMLNLLCREVRESTGYQTVWFGIYLPEKNSFRVHTLQSEGVPIEWDKAEEIPVETVPFLQQLVENHSGSVIEDARTDPRVNREISDRVGNRTIINIPMAFGDHVLGALAMGTFREEGVRLPTPEQLEYLHKLANTVDAAGVRVLRLEQDRAERRSMSSRLLDEIAELIAAIEADAAKLSGSAEQTGKQIAELTQRVAELVEYDRNLWASPTSDSRDGLPPFS